MEDSSARSSDSHRSGFRPGSSEDDGEQRETALEELEHFPTRRSICIGLRGGAHRRLVRRGGRRELRGEATERQIPSFRPRAHLRYDDLAHGDELRAG